MFALSTLAGKMAGCTLCACEWVCACRSLSVRMMRVQVKVRGRHWPSPWAVECVRSAGSGCSAWGVAQSLCKSLNENHRLCFTTGPRQALAWAPPQPLSIICSLSIYPASCNHVTTGGCPSCSPHVLLLPPIYWFCKWR